MNKFFRLYLIISVLLVLQAGLIYLLLVSGSDTKNQASHSAYINDQEFYEQAFSQGQLQVIKPTEHVRAGILPHHLIVKDKIAAFFQGLKAEKYQTIILLGPNHYNNGTGNIIISVSDWSTPYGILEADQAVIQKLNYPVEEQPFTIEHSISGLVSFIKKAQPEAKIVPIILKRHLPSNQAEKLAADIYQAIDPQKTLILASVDFSHDFTTDIANQHDLISQQAIESFALDTIYDLDLDSPPAIYTLLKYSLINDINTSQLLWHTNSGDLIGNTSAPTTSHHFYYFY